MPLKLVPFNNTWVDHHKIDVHAIYRRPRFVKDQYDDWVRERDAEGRPTWDLTGPLPVRSHNRWLAKGFEYVTLANKPSLLEAARFNTLPAGEKASDYMQSQAGGPWNFRKYLEGMEETVREDTRQLWNDVDEAGSEIVERVWQKMDPGFRLPVELRDKKPGQLSREAEEQEKRRMQAQAEHPSSPVGRTRKIDQVAEAKS